MQQVPQIVIDARHTLYDFKYKFNAQLAYSLKLLSQICPIRVIFIHKNKDKNERLSQQLTDFIAKNTLNIHIDSSMDININSLVITHLPSQFASHKICYFSSYIQSALKKSTIESAFYQSGGGWHISNLLQVQPYLQGVQLNKQVVGYYFYPKKLNELSKVKILLNTENITYIPIDFRFYNANQYKTIKAIFHKLLDIFKSTEINLKPEEVTIFENNYRLMTSEFKIPEQSLYKLSLDPIDQLRPLINRDTFTQQMNYLLNHQKYHIDSKLKFRTPLQSSFNNDGSIIPQQIKFPLIVKTKLGALTTNCHIMAIVAHQEGLEAVLKKKDFQCELIFQDVVNHDNLIYKIYCIGDYQILQKRKSIPNISVDNFKLQEGYYVFDTQQDLFGNVIKCLNDVPENNYLTTELPHEIELKKHLDLIQKLIIEEFGIKLFGFDIIGDLKTMEFFIIDLNHCPGYKNVKDIDLIFEQLFLKQINI